MNFLYSFATTFVINYLIIWIISLFGIKKRNLIAFIVISIINISNICFNIYALWTIYLHYASQNALAAGTTDLLLVSGELVAYIIAYIATCILLLDGKKIFKSRRQKQYMNAVNNRSKKWPIIYIIVLVLLGAGALTYGIITSINFTYELLIAAVGAYGIALVFFGLAYYIFFINFTNGTSSSPINQNSNVINAIIINKTKVDLYLLFILNLGNNKYYFEGLLDETHTINYYLGNILNVYVLTDFGSINKDNSKTIVKGIKVEKIDENLLKEIKLNRIKPEEKFLNIVSNFERYRVKQIYVDNADNVVKILEK